MIIVISILRDLVEKPLEAYKFRKAQQSIVMPSAATMVNQIS